MRFSNIKNKLGNKYFDGGVVNPLDIFQRNLSNQELPKVFEQQVQPPMVPTPPAAQQQPMAAPAPANQMSQILNQPYQGQDFSDADIQTATAESKRLAEESGVEDLTDQFGKTKDVLSTDQDFSMPSFPKSTTPELNIPPQEYSVGEISQGRDVMEERRKALSEILGRYA